MAWRTLELSVLERIAQLRAVSQVLEPDSDQRAALREKVVAHAEAFLQSLPTAPAFQFSETEGRGILESPLAETPMSAEAALDLLRRHVEPPGVRLGSPGHLAFIPISTLHTAALGDYLAAITNPFSGNFFAAPGAVRLEHLLTRWLADFIGYPPDATGNLTSGGSLSNLAALVTAREARKLRSRDYEKAVVYLSPQTHHSLTKALRIAGLSDCPQRVVSLDDQYRMRPDLLDRTIVADQTAGLRPWLIVATAGSTDTGAIDPLPALAEIAQRRGLWLHTDGAYGAVFALCAPGKQALAGMESSDSLVLDPHKGLFMPCGLGAVLVRKAADLLRAYRYEAPYLQDRRTLASADELSPSELSPELTRPFRGLRLWLALKVHGVRAFRAALEEKLLLARYFHEQLQKLENFVAGPPPALSIVTFRFVPPRGDANDFNKRLLTAIQRDGRVFISSTILEGKTALRVAVLCAATHLETIDLTLEILKRKAAELRAGSA